MFLVSHKIYPHSLFSLYRSLALRIRETDTKLTTAVPKQHISAYCNEETLSVNPPSLKIDQR